MIPSWMEMVKEDISFIAFGSDKLKCKYNSALVLEQTRFGLSEVHQSDICRVANI
jgi:hypothetical protein